MNGIIPFEFGKAQNELNDKKEMHVVHRQIIERTDGSKSIKERSADHVETVDIEGSKWLVRGNPFWDGKEDNDSAHKRKNKKTTVWRESVTEIDALGNKVTDEKAIQMNDEHFVKGSKTIGILPAKKLDPRDDMLKKFGNNEDPFNLLGGKFTPLIGGDGGFNA